MGFYAKTVCPRCGLIKETHYEGNVFGEKSIITKCECGYLYGNRTNAVEFQRDDEPERELNPEWAKKRSDEFDGLSIRIESICPKCFYVKKHNMRLIDLDNVSELTSCKCGYTYHLKSNLRIKTQKCVNT